MVVQQEVQKLLHSLVIRESSMITIGSSEILVRLINKGDKVLLTTPVYYGGNYIPQKVREAATERRLIQSELISAELVINQDKFEIYLEYSEDAKNLDIDRFKEDLEEFAWLADEWRLILDQEDYNDRLHIIA